MSDAPGYQYIYVAPPRKGLIEGINPLTEEFPEDASPDIENVRVAAMSVATRLGSTLWKTLIGSGDVRGLWDIYTTDGNRYRLAARGTGASGALQDYKEGTDSAFQAVSGGGSLGGTVEPYFTGVTFNDLFYYLDRAGALRKYSPAGRSSSTVALPVKPSAAPGVKPRWWDLLEDWSGSEPFGWTETDASSFDIDAYTDRAPPIGSNAAILHPININAPPAVPIYKNVSGESIPSHTIAFYINAGRAVQTMAFQFGQVSPTDFTFTIRCPTQDDWYPVFVDVGNLGTINYKRWQVLSTSNFWDHAVSMMVLPGRLQGAYRWLYTHYDPSTGRESAPSDISNGGTPVDLSTVGVSYQTAAAAAFNKCAVLTFTSDSGVDASTTQIRIYRNGGAPSLTSDEQGNDVWLRVGTVYDQSTTINHGGGYAAAATSFVVAAATNIAIGDWLVLGKGTVGTEEYVRVTNVSGTTITIAHGLQFAHADASSVQLAFMDNVANESIDVTQTIEIARQDPPSAAKWIARTGDGRLVLFNYSGHPTGVAFSNRATPDRATDYEVMPSGVDPLTRRSLTQGWQIELRGDSTDETIVWGGVFQGQVCALTRTNLYVINGNSQADWGPDSVQIHSRIGCIAGDTVVECNGALYWVADGARLVRWTGRNSAPEVVSHLRANVRLSAAPTAYWSQWFARYHVRKDGHYYALYFTPSGQTTNTQRLDFNIDLDAFEPCTYKDSNAAYLGFRGASVRDGGSDTHDLYQVDTAGKIYQTETGLTDNSVAISIRYVTKAFLLGVQISPVYTMRRFPKATLGLLHRLWAWLTVAGTDTLTLTVKSEGSEYQTVSHVYTQSLSANAVQEISQRLDRDLLGRWGQFTLTGDVSNGPELRQLEIGYVPVRSGRHSA